MNPSRREVIGYLMKEFGYNKTKATRIWWFYSRKNTTAIKGLMTEAELEKLLEKT